MISPNHPKTDEEFTAELNRLADAFEIPEDLSGYATLSPEWFLTDLRKKNSICLSDPDLNAAQDVCLATRPAYSEVRRIWVNLRDAPEALTLLKELKEILEESRKAINLFRGALLPGTWLERESKPYGINVQKRLDLVNIMLDAGKPLIERRRRIEEIQTTQLQP